MPNQQKTGDDSNSQDTSKYAKNKALTESTPKENSPLNEPTRVPSNVRDNTANVQKNHKQNNKLTNLALVVEAWDKLPEAVNGGVKLSHLTEQKCTTYSLYSQDHPGRQVPILLC